MNNLFETLSNAMKPQEPTVNHSLTILQKQGDRVLAQCACGTVKTYRGASVRSGATKSCGCEKGKAQKLTVNQVKEIRNLHAEGHKMSRLARKFNVSPPTIRLIVLKRIWKWV